MTSTKKGIVLSVLIGILIGSIGIGVSMADEPQLLVYPNMPTVFRYDPSRYELLGPSDPEFDPLYAISDQMLWDMVDGRIPVEVYRAPELVGFELSPVGGSGFTIMRNEFIVIVDGFSPYPRTYSNLYMRFIPQPSNSFVEVYVQSQLIEGLVTPIPGFTVSTPIAGGYFSDTMRRHINWSGAIGLRITVYSDKDNDGFHDGGGSDGSASVSEFSIFVEDNTVSTRETTWGAIKALYRGQ